MGGRRGQIKGRPCRAASVEARPVGGAHKVEPAGGSDCVELKRRPALPANPPVRRKNLRTGVAF